MRALIVDDEARVRKAVHLLVDWERHGIQEVAEAGSGDEAIELIRHNKPGLVITDMLMDSGNGLELMAWISEFAGSVKFIVVSGHNDFEFVRSTVRHGGIDYILKPIDAEAINAAVAKAVTEWRAEERERADQQQQNIQLNEIRPVYGEKLLSSLIDDANTAESSLRRLRADQVIPEQANRVRLLLLQVDSGDALLLQRFGKDSELLHFSVINICNEFLLPDRRGIAFKYWGAPGEIILMLWNNHEAVAELIEKINQGLLRTLQRRMHFGVAAAGALPQSLPSQYAEANAAIRHRNLLHSGSYLHTLPTAEPHNGGETGNASCLRFVDVQEDWKMAVLSGGNEQRIAAAAQKWIDGLSHGGIVTPEMLEQWRSEALSFREQLLRETLGDDAGAVLAALVQDDRQHRAPNTNGYSFSLFAWRDWAVDLMSRMSQAISGRQAKEKRAIRDIIKYIEQHYTSELSLQDIAGRFFVSREYISRKFKQEFGINFSDYLSKYRIDKAKLLMLNPNLKISQIAEMVGIHDVKYFSKVFKKQEGVSPKEYRHKLSS
ncbi:response regulator [Paenibacillus sp. P96]|uniref:Response regulator n=1 Tax=Paenibacillus zeirhizosphaerae TaxID=2987519 RepID=A0ABT9FRM4_9BACL|nr:helix-turn-helix domain-containing protein [Paenibacillus sp. P96]MDP4097364.1 response regulator [Paenibacillus sp. P96]